MRMVSNKLHTSLKILKTRQGKSHIFPHQIICCVANVNYDHASYVLNLFKGVNKIYMVSMLIFTQVITSKNNVRHEILLISRVSLGGSINFPKYITRKLLRE